MPENISKGQTDLHCQTEQMHKMAIYGSRHSSQNELNKIISNDIDSQSSLAGPSTLVDLNMTSRFYSTVGQHQNRHIPTKRSNSEEKDL